MLARDLAEEYPTVDVDSDALEAARLLAARHLPGLLVLEHGQPVAILPSSQVLRVVIPEYMQEDPSLARVVNEIGADQIVHELHGRRVRDLLPAKPSQLPVLRADDTVLELAALMAQLRCPLVAVTGDDGLVGVVTSSHLLELALRDA